MKPTYQVNNAASKANSMLGLLKSIFQTRDQNIWKKLYSCYVRPQIEFAVPCWSPYAKKDINTLEKVQQRATKIPNSLKNLNYRLRCNKLQLKTLSNRRLRGDLIQFFKIENGIEKINWHFRLTKSEPRSGHNGQFRREIIRFCNQRHEFFNNRTANIWNKLPNEIKSA